MKKYMTLLLCLMLVCATFTACGGGAVDDSEEIDDALAESEQVVEVDEDKLEKAGSTLEDRLYLLKKDGWKSKDGAYVYTSSEDECDGEYVITANGNNADLKVNFDYFDDNAEMVDFYKDDPGMAQAVCAYWYMRAVAVLDAPLGSTKYSLSVGRIEVTSGSMTYAEAEAVYDEYYED